MYEQWEKQLDVKKIQPHKKNSRLEEQALYETQRQNKLQPWP